MKSWEDVDIVMLFMTSSSDVKTEGCRNSKLYFETKSPTNVTCIMKKENPDDARLIKL